MTRLVVGGQPSFVLAAAVGVCGIAPESVGVSYDCSNDSRPADTAEQTAVSLMAKSVSRLGCETRWPTPSAYSCMCKENGLA